MIFIAGPGENYLGTMSFCVKTFLGGCFSVETGVKVVGVIQAMLSFISLFWNIFSFLTMENGDEEDQEDHQQSKVMHGLSTIFDLVSIIVNTILVAAVAKRSTTMLLPAMVWTTCEIIICIIVFFMPVAFSFLDQLDLSLIIFMFLLFFNVIFKTQLFVVIKSLYSDFKKFDRGNIRHSLLV